MKSGSLINFPFRGRQHPIAGPQPSASTPNLLSDHNKTATNTSDESDETKESTSISKASLKLDESQNNTPSLTKNDLRNALDNNSSRADNNTLLLSLIKQINLLHETNTKIFHNLQETKGKWSGNHFFFLVEITLNSSVYPFFAQLSDIFPYLLYFIYIFYGISFRVP